MEKRDAAIQVPGGVSCRERPTVEIHPSGGHFEDYTHACDAHIGALLGHFDDQPDPHHYEVRPLTDEECANAWCCHVEVPVSAD